MSNHDELTRKLAQTTVRPRSRPSPTAGFSLSFCAAATTEPMCHSFSLSFALPFCSVVTTTQPALIAPIAWQYVIYMGFGALVLLLSLIYATTHVVEMGIILALVLTGLAMIMFGAVSFKALQYNWWMVLAAVLVANCALLLAVMVGSATGIIVGMNVASDPVHGVLVKSFQSASWRRQFWTTQPDYCQAMAPAQCGDGAGSFVKLAGDARAGADGVHTVADVFGDCSLAADLVSGAGGDELTLACEDCAEECRRYLTIDGKDFLFPATVLVAAVFGLMVLTIIVNDQLISEPEKWTFGPLMGYVMTDKFEKPSLIRCHAYGLNGLCAALGGVMGGLAAHEQRQLRQVCEDDGGGQCESFAIGGVVFVGILLTVLGLLNVLVLLVHTPLSQVTVRLVNYCFVLFAFVLLICAIFLGIISGGLTSVEETLDEHYLTFRRQYEQRDPTYCAGSAGECAHSLHCGAVEVCVGETCELNDEACKQKMFADLEGSILSAAILALCVAIGIAFVCKVDLQAVKMCKRAGMLIPGISDS